MTVYIIAQLKLTDRAAYERYQRAFAAVFARFQGKLLVADEAPIVLEGAFPRDKVVVMQFPTREEAERFANDPEYQAISRDRHAGADTVSVLVRGLQLKAAEPTR
ncbi:MAG: DUF1330 domain-containing protein [Polyangiales bacterium]